MDELKVNNTETIAKGKPRRGVNVEEKNKRTNRVKLNKRKTRSEEGGRRGEQIVDDMYIFVYTMYYMYDMIYIFISRMSIFILWDTVKPCTR